MTTDLTLAVAGVFLVSFWKPLLLLPPFLFWGWLISTHLDKDARRYHLNPRMWNGIHLAAGVVALAVALLIPIFLIGWVAAMVVLATPIFIYWQLRNREVPETARFTMSSLHVGQRMEARRQRKASREALVQFADPAGVERPVPGKDDPLLPVHVLAEDLIGPAVSARASRLEVVVAAAGTSVTQTIDGVRYKRPPAPADAGATLVDYLKGIARLDVQDRRRRQSGQMSMRGPTGRVQIWVATEGSASGQKLTLEFEREKAHLRPFDGLGLLGQQLEALRAFEPRQDRHGLIIFGSPPGHGTTTTGYSLVARHDAYTSNIKTLEREVVAPLDGVDQVVWDPNNPNIDFATALQSMLRRDPDIVLTAEITDAETAGVAVGPGPTGPLLYIPVRASSVSEQVAQWARLVGEVKKATRGLRAVINQRLLRSLCPNCRQGYAPSADQLKQLNLPAGKVKQFYRAVGKVQVKNKVEACPVCGGTGYFGQTGAFEVLFVDDDARRMLQGSDLKGALAHARRNKMILLQEAALSKVFSGETSLEEVSRVLGGKSASAQPPRERTPTDAATTPG